MIGRLICDRYEVLDHLGTGGMATVWLAEDTILNRKVAVKTFKIDSNDIEAIKRFNREANAVTTLSHENIVSIYGVENEDNFYYLILEYVEGQTLKDYMNKNKNISLEGILRIGKQIALALAHAHENGIIHRDIKPQNILLTKDLNCKITDFGISRTYGDTTLTQTNQMLGTVYYLSPEQARGNVATSQSDIYSLGIILFELLTGKIPFNGESAVAIALKHLQEQLPNIDSYRSNVPQSLKNVIIKSTMKNPNERYVNAIELHDDLLTSLNSERIHEDKYEGFVPSKQIVEQSDKEKNIIKTNNLKVHTSVRAYSNRTNSTENKGAKKNKKSYFGQILLAIIVSIGAIISASYTYSYYVNSSKVTVPNVENMTVEQAKIKLTSQGFKVEITEINNDIVARNLVINSDPLSGKKVEKGSVINLRVSLGKKEILMPNLIGSAETEIKESMEKIGFKKVIYEREEHDTAPEGTVFYQSINGGSSIVAGDTSLLIKISKGRKSIKSIDLIGKSLNDAQDIANNNGFKIVVSSSEYSHNYKENVIINQNPEVNTIIKKGDSISVTISKGKDPNRFERTVKDFISRNVNDLENWAKEYGVKLNEQVIESDQEEGTVLR